MQSVILIKVICS